MADQDGGIMQKIQAITAPPHPSPTSKQRRGKAKAINNTLSVSRQSGIDNHPYCDACGDGGNLLCCERCPASFHFVCCDPPLDPLNLPEGEWVCNNCRPLPSNIESHQNALFRPILIQACSENPLIFYLPSDMMSMATFSDIKLNRKSQTDSTSTVYCYLCNRSSRCGPILSCDFCPLSYHMDCLTPPVTDSPLPSSWMCPNHIEHSITGLQNIRLSERKKALDKCRAEINRHSIKMDFLTTLKRIPHYKRVTTRTNRRTTEVPASIRDLYAHPLEDSLSVSPLSQLLLTATEQLELLRREGERERERESIHFVRTPSLTQAQNEWTAHRVLERIGIPRKQHCQTTKEDLQEILGTNSESLCNGLSEQSTCNENPPTHSSSIIPNIELLDDKFVKLLATQRLQQFLSNDLVSHKAINGLKQEPSSTPLHYSRNTKRKRDFDPLGLLCPLTSGGVAVPILTTSITIGSGSEMDVCLTKYGHCNYISPHHACLILDKETGEYELINYSEHGSIVDGVLYSCDFSEKSSHEETVLLLDDVLSLGEGRKATNAKHRLETTRTSLIDKERAKLVLSSALKLSKSINKDCVVDWTKLPDIKRREYSSSSEPSSPESSTISVLPPRQSPPTIDTKGGCDPLLEKTTPSHLTNKCLSAHKSNQPCSCKRSASSLIGGSGKGWEGSALVSHGSKLRFGCIQLMLSVSDRPGHLELLHALIDAGLL